MILFVGIVLTASTYAWFTTNRNVQVNSIDVNVSASDGLLISADAVSWGPSISAADLLATTWGDTNQLPGRGTANGSSLVPVSTGGNVTNGRLEMFKGTVTADEAKGTFNITSSVSGETKTSADKDAGDFVAFDIFLQSTKDQKLYLAKGSGVSITGTNTDTGIKNAARVAFLNQGNVEQGSGAAAARTLNGANSAWIWEPNFEMHTAAGYDNAVNLYGMDTGLFSGSSAAGYTTTAALPYKGLIKAFPTDEETDFVDQEYNNIDPKYLSTDNVSTTQTSSTWSTDASATNVEYIELKSGVTKIRVYMWFEGQDVDCEDRASGGTVTLDLKFSLDNGATS